MVDATYSPKIYRKQGGDELVVASAGLITVESGGIIAGPTGQSVGIAQSTTTTADAIALNGVLTALTKVGILAAT